MAMGEPAGMHKDIDIDYPNVDRPDFNSKPPEIGWVSGDPTGPGNKLRKIPAAVLAALVMMIMPIIWILTSITISAINSLCSIGMYHGWDMAYGIYLDELLKYPGGNIFAPSFICFSIIVILIRLRNS